jgi:hypothetical protein
VDGEGVKLALAAAVAGAVLGCEARAQDAGPGPDQTSVQVAIPAGWTPLPTVVEAGLAAAAEARGRPLGVRAWGEPSLGCFATIVRVTGTRAEHVARVAEQFRATLALDTQIEGWTFTDGPAAEASATIARGVLRGALRGRFATDAAGLPHGAFAACFYNERDPARCQAACTGLLASLEPPKVSP